MERAFGLTIPQTLDEACDPARMALLVYDMQVGVLTQIPDAGAVTGAVVRVLDAARQAGVRVLFSRHLSLPREIMGVVQLRMAMAWQRVTSVDAVHPWFLRGLRHRAQKATGRAWPCPTIGPVPEARKLTGIAHECVRHED